MKITTRLQLAELVCIAVVVASVAVLVGATGQMKRELAKNAAANEVLGAVTSLRYLTLEYALRHEDRAQAQWTLRSKSLASLLDGAGAVAEGETVDIIAGLKRGQRGVDTLFAQLVSNQRLLANDATKRQVLDDLENRLSGQIANQIHAMIADAISLSAHSREGALAAQEYSTFAAMLAGVVIVFVVGLTILVTVRSIARPLARLQEATAAVGVGNLDFALDVSTHDEIGDLARAFDGMTRQLKGTTVSRDALAVEVKEREQAERKVLAQVGRLNLLHQITRSIGERQDLRSIFGVITRRLEDELPIDFACVLLHDDTAGMLATIHIGARSTPLAAQLDLRLDTQVPIDANGLSRCLRGELIYEDDIGAVPFPFPQRLARGGLQALVMAPLQVENIVFGVLVVARRAARSFSSGDCEFLRQLSEHAALAAHQARLYSDLQRTYDDLRQSQRSIMQQERLRALGQMASGIAHDINNAISPVALYTESLLETESGLSAHGRNCLEVIERSIDDVAATVARMREFYRQREPDTTLAPVDLNQMVRHVTDLTKARWSDMPQQRGIVVKLDPQLDQGLPAVMGIEGEIREALTNLIFNAVDAMPDGGTLTLRTGSCGPADPAHAFIEVGDSGVGMDEDTRRRCLEPFFTTKGERGTGLGLAMVFGMVERHGAKLSIATAPKSGTTMRLAFQVCQGAAMPASAPQAAPPAQLRILIVDDDPMVLKALRDILELDGHEVVAADGGQQALHLFCKAQEASDPFSLVITDLGMPYLDGRKVAAAVKQHAPATPVILLTGWGQRLLSDGEPPACVDCVLGKPPKLRELREALVKLGSGAAARTASA